MNNQLPANELDAFVADLSATVKKLAELLPRLVTVAAAYRGLAENDRQRADGYKDQLRTVQGQLARATGDIDALHAQLQAGAERENELTREIRRLQAR